MTKALVLVLGDQLSPSLSSLRAARPDRDVVFMAEVREEATYVKHHKKKIAFLFSAMRHFADELRAAGWTVDYSAFDPSRNDSSFGTALEDALARHRPDRVIVTEPGEWRVLQMMRAWPQLFGTPVDILPDTRFVCSTDEFAAWTANRKQLRMEFFYRDMRRKTSLLMNGDEPEAGQWNFDKDNRKPARRDMMMPARLYYEPDAITRDVIRLVQDNFGHHFGDLEPFHFGVTRAAAAAAFAHFLETALPSFGDFQDAMLRDERFLYHSVVSMYLNAGLLDPLEMCRAVEFEYRAGRVPLNSAEGYIRQVIGWREYVRGIYWLRMPGYIDQNYLDARRPLPGFYWDAETDMACMRAAVTQTKEEAYSHHIQRLMVTGNFALIAGIEPKLVHEWYLIVYADAYEWVELPNTLGMSLFGDGGLLGSKPYAASGAYINRMSDYCPGCRYNVKQRTGPDACPFNALYWDFLARNRGKLGSNPRLRQIYSGYDRFGREERQRIKVSAARFLAKLAPSPYWP